MKLSNIKRYLYYNNDSGVAGLKYVALIGQIVIPAIWFVCKDRIKM